MDLRKSVLIKQTLSDSCLNVSNTSAYESAAEGNDTTLFYSFSNDDSVNRSADDDSENFSMSSDADKENTMIQKRQSIQTESKITNESDNSLVLITKGGKNENISDAVLEVVKITARESKVLASINEFSEENIVSDQVMTEQIATDESAERIGTSCLDSKKVLTLPKVPFLPSNEVIMEEKIDEIEEIPIKFEESVTLPTTLAVSLTQYASELLPEVLTTINSPMVEVDDPNENIVNPFTGPPVVEVTTKRITRRSVVTKIPSTTLGVFNHLYSPVLRKSIDRKGKPAAARRTIMKIENNPSPSKGSGISKKTSTVILPMVKPKTYKCSVAACFNEEFPTMKAYQDHQKLHRGTNIATTKFSFNCKWCDKKFQLENALINHQAENCSKIPAVEKRKIIVKGEKREKDRRRTTLFAPPMTKRKSPMRRPVSDVMNRSGIKITPKKSLKCHLCTEIVNDAVSLANHILSHKFNRENNP